MNKSLQKMLIFYYSFLFNCILPSSRFCISFFSCRPCSTVLLDSQFDKIKQIASGAISPNNQHLHYQYIYKIVIGKPFAKLYNLVLLSYFVVPYLHFLHPYYVMISEPYSLVPTQYGQSAYSFFRLLGYVICCSVRESFQSYGLKLYSLIRNRL